MENEEPSAGEEFLKNNYTEEQRAFIYQSRDKIVAEDGEMALHGGIIVDVLISHVSSFVDGGMPNELFQDMVNSLLSSLAIITRGNLTGKQLVSAYEKYKAMESGAMMFKD